MIVRVELKVEETEAIGIFNGFAMSAGMIPNIQIAFTQLRFESDRYVFECTIPVDIIETMDDDIVVVTFEKRKESDYSYNLHKIFGEIE